MTDHPEQPDDSAADDGSCRDRAREDRVDEVLAEYMRQVDSNESVTPEQLFAAHPDLADELGAYFSNADRLAARTVHAAGPAPTAAYRSGPVLPAKIHYFGDYELLEEIARGGMGVVYRARQRSLNRIVAVKMILSGTSATEREVERFYEEATAAAQLVHPSIVRVVEVGTHEDHHYYSMEYVAGGSLADRLVDGPMPPERAAAVIRCVADAVGYANEQGVLHRDIKPANVLLTEDGRPMLSDFGLAKRIDADLGLTRTGELVGTPSYMAPEQAVPGMRGIGPWTDVYSLGAVLYALLTGRPPVDARTPQAALAALAERDPTPPRQYLPKLHRDLETICLKCLEKKPKDRYASATELAEELERFAEGRPIRARPVGLLTRAWRWARRKPMAAALIGFVIVAVVAAPLVAHTFGTLRHRVKKLAVESSRARSDAAQRAEEAVAANEHADQSLGMARQAIDTFLIQGSEDPSLRFGGFEHIRIDFLEAARDYYESFIQFSDQNAGIDVDFAVIQSHMSRVYLALDNRVAAEASARRAIQIYEQLNGGNESGVETGKSLINEYAWLADLRTDAGDDHGAMEHLNKAVQIGEAMVAAQPDSAQFRGQLGYLYGTLAMVRLRLGQQADAETAIAKACEQLTQAHKADSSDDTIRMHVGNLFLHRARLREAEREFEQALSDCLSGISWLDDAFVGNNALHATYLTSLAMAHEQTARLYLKLSKSLDAHEYFLRSRKVWTTIANNFPGRPEFQYGFVRAQHNLADYFGISNMWAHQAIALKDAIRHAKALIATHGEKDRYIAELASLWVDLGQAVLYDANGSLKIRGTFQDELLGLSEVHDEKMQRIDTALHKGMHVLRDSDWDKPDDPTILYLEARLHRLRGFHQALAGSSDSAISSLQKAGKLCDELLQRDPKNAKYVLLRATCYYELTHCIPTNGDHDRIRATLDQAIKLITGVEDQWEEEPELRVLLKKCRAAK